LVNELQNVQECPPERPVSVRAGDATKAQWGFCRSLHKIIYTFYTALLHLHLQELN